MAKKKTWFSLIKSFFISEPQLKPEKKEKRTRWVFRLLKIKKLSPLPETSPAKERLTWQTAEQSNICVISPQHEVASQNQAATKIQAAFRRYLARKALQALKGVVRLQALIRGWAVRKQAIHTLKCLQSIVNIQTEVCSKRSERIKSSLYCQEYKCQDFKEKDIKTKLQAHSNSQKRWEDSTLTKDKLNALFLTKREASTKRDRIREYYLNHRRSAETERDKVHGRRKYWLEQWVDAQLAKSPTLGNLDRNFSANSGYLQRQYQAELPDPHAYIPTKSGHHRKQHSIGNDNSFPGSPIIPAYMASTESAKAKARSLSSPRLRPLNFDVCSETMSPYKRKCSPISSINSELTSSTWVENHLNTSQRSLGLKGPVKSTMSTKELRIRGIYYQNGNKAVPTDETDSKV